MRKLFITILILTSGISYAQEITNISLDSNSPLSDSGLYFSGTKGVDYIFGHRITPQGDCIEAINNYIFVSWYKGGMDQRNLMLSRKHIDSVVWKTIQFPDTLIGYKGDTTVGDSHNYASVGICPRDGTVHLLYDMHAYREVDFPDNFFNYRVSIKNAAFVPREQWDINLFNDKRDFLKENNDFDRTTYPEFIGIKHGKLLANWRAAGAGKGNLVYAIYDGAWTYNILFSNGIDEPLHNRSQYSIYGSFDFLHGKLHTGFSIRQNSGPYPTNNGLFYASTISPGNVTWTDAFDSDFNRPIENPYELFVAEPINSVSGDKITIAPIWTASEFGDIHFITKVTDTASDITTNVHVYKGATDSSFSFSENNCPAANGRLFALGENILAVTLENKKLLFRSTSAGEHNWTTIYQENSLPNITYCNIEMLDDKIFVIAMTSGTGDARPLTLLTYDIEFNGGIAIEIEAENYDEGGEGVAYHDFDEGNSGGAYRNEDVDISAVSAASNGHCVSQFKGVEWLNYTFDVAVEGNYKLEIFASNRNLFDARIDVSIDGNLVFNNTLLSRTFNWEVFRSTEMPQHIFLTPGTHTIKIDQESSLASNLDKFRLSLMESTSNPGGRISQELTAEVVSSAIINEPSPIRIYPNPVNNSLSISSARVIERIEIYNTTGILISSYSPKTTDIVIDTNNYTKGVYFVIIDNTFYKLIKE